MGWRLCTGDVWPRSTPPLPRRRRRPRRREQGPQGADKETTIPVVEEEISVGTRQVERGTARIHTRVTEHPVEEAVRLREEHVTVERHPVNRPAGRRSGGGQGTDD